jgi:hypothetical protein
MKNTYLNVIAVGVSLFASAPFTVFADEIFVEEFVSGTIISSADVNSNFDTLAKESNENDARISAIEASPVLNTDAASSGFIFDGYTTQAFARSAYGETLNFYTLSNHCKQEFGPSSFVLTTRILTSLITQSDTFTPPSADPAFIIWDSGRTVYYDRGTSSEQVAIVDNIWSGNGQQAFGPASISPNGRLGTIYQMGTDENPSSVACASRS